MPGFPDSLPGGTGPAQGTASLITNDLADVAADGGAHHRRAGRRAAFRDRCPAGAASPDTGRAARQCLHHRGTAHDRARRAVRHHYRPHRGQRGGAADLGGGIVSNEAADASRLAWAATSAGVNPAPIQSALLGYLQATRADEWQGNQAADGDDPATSHALASLENVVRAQAARPGLASATSSELLDSLDALTSDRRARLAAASRQLPAFYVVVLVVAGAALIINATVLTLRSRWRAGLPVGGLVAVIGLSLALLFALGTPWRGSITVSGQPIDAVTQDLHTGYFHR